MSRGAARAVLAGLCCLLPVWDLRAEQPSVDLQLVLAVDGSASVDREEFALQMGGIAAALRDPEVLEAIARGPHGRIAVAVTVWSEPDGPKDRLPWHAIEDRQSAEDYAELVEHRPRRVRPGGTGIGKAVIDAADYIEASGLDSLRKVIDLSGDGAESAFRDWGIPTRQGRSYAMARGITVNGLAILNDEPDLRGYYDRHLIGGPGAFVMAVETYYDFAEAMTRKLIREIGRHPAVSRRSTQGFSAVPGIVSAAPSMPGREPN